MSIRTFAVAGFTTEAVADAVGMANSKYMALQGGTTTQRTKIKEVEVGGLEASVSSPQKLLLAFDGTVAGTKTALTTGESDIADDALSVQIANPCVAFVAQSATAPQRAKAYLANFAFNAIGGLARIRFPFGEEPMMFGNAAFAAGTAGGEVSLSGFTGTTPGVIGAHIKYETV